MQIDNNNKNRVNTVNICATWTAFCLPELTAGAGSFIGIISYTATSLVLAFVRHSPKS
jgi:hypothetical protein